MKQAAAICREVLSLNPNVESTPDLAAVREKLHTATESLITNARALLAVGDIAGARAAFADVSGANPTSATALERQAYCSLLLGDWKAAAACAQQAAALKPGFAAAHCLSGTALKAVGRQEEARQHFTQRCVGTWTTMVRASGAACARFSRINLAPPSPFRYPTPSVQPRP